MLQTSPKLGFQIAMSPALSSKKQNLIRLKTVRVMTLQVKRIIKWVYIVILPTFSGIYRPPASSLER